MREQLVSNEWIDKALLYWTDLNEIKNGWDSEPNLENFFNDELTPEITHGVPFQDWECRYCQFYSICPSTLADKKPRF